MYVQITSYVQDVARKYFLGVEVLSYDAYLPILVNKKFSTLSDVNECHSEWPPPEKKEAPSKFVSNGGRSMGAPKKMH